MELIQQFNQKCIFNIPRLRLIMNDFTSPFTKHIHKHTRVHWFGIHIISMFACELDPHYTYVRTVLLLFPPSHHRGDAYSGVSTNPLRGGVVQWTHVSTNTYRTSCCYHQPSIIVMYYCYVTVKVQQVSSLVIFGV